MLRSSFLFFGLVLVPSMLACTATVTPIPGGGTNEPPPSTIGQPAPEPTGTATTETPKPPVDPPTDPPKPAAPVLTISGAGYANEKVSTKYAFDVTFTLENTGSTSVSSIDTMTYDFG